MAKITLTIEAESDSDLHQTLANLCDRLEGNYLSTADIAHMQRQASEPLVVDRDKFLGLDDGPQEELDPPEEQGHGAEAGAALGGSSQEDQLAEGRRRRRTKAELEQDPEWRKKNGLPPLETSGAQSAAAGSTTAGSATDASSALPGAKASSLFGIGSASSAGSQPAAEGATKPLFGIGAGAAAPAAGDGGEDIDKAFKDAFRASMARRGAKATQEILVATAGVRMTAEVKPEQYAAVIAAFLAG